MCATYIRIHDNKSRDHNSEMNYSTEPKSLYYLLSATESDAIPVLNVYRDRNYRNKSCFQNTRYVTVTTRC